MPYTIAGQTFPLGPSPRVELVNAASRDVLADGPGVYVIVEPAGYRAGQPVWQPVRCGADDTAVLGALVEAAGGTWPESWQVAARLEDRADAREQIVREVQRAIGGQP